MYCSTFSLSWPQGGSGSSMPRLGHFHPAKYTWHPLQCGQGGSVNTATDYGMDGPGIEFRWGRYFSHTSRPALGYTQSPGTKDTGSFPGVKRPGRCADHQPLLSLRSRMSRAIPLLPLWALDGLL
jgi:hypothetical protein